MINKSVLFLGKKNDENTAIAASFLKNNFSEVIVCLGEWGDPFPEDFKHWNGDLIISYLSRWKVPKSLIDNADLSINFHPGSHEYPGIGCINFALYDNASNYGVCCHHISEKIDAGKIIDVDTFPIFQTDNVERLLERTYAYQIAQFYKVITFLLKGEPLPISALKWERKPFKRTEFESLKIITHSMSEEEIARRIRATSYKSFQPKVVLGKHTFTYQSER